MLKIYSTEQARAIDLRASQEFAIPSAELMARAGRAAAALLLSRWPLAQRILVLCGPGNNGGDGYVVANLLTAAVRDVAVFAYGEPQAARNPDAYAASQVYRQKGVFVSANELNQALADADLVVDALFGIGTRPLSSDLADELAAIVTRLNALNKPVLALDVPSGLNSDTGACDLAVRASETITFIAYKLGLFTGQARRFVGALSLAPLDLAPAVFAGIEPVAQALSSSAFAKTQRSAVAHKGQFGHVWTVGGAPGFAGAVHLCAQAALRAGAGRVSVITDVSNVAGLVTARAELMVRSDAQLPDFLTGMVLAIGPGLSKSGWARRLFAQALNWSGPRVFDADALNLLAELDLDRTGSSILGPNTVLTPHPAEAARLMGVDTAAIESNRPAAAHALAAKYGCVVLLKGAGALIAAPNLPLGVCVFGNAGMASGGMGDVLTGVIAALLAQGLEPFDAAEQGALLHAQAGDRAAAVGMRGMIAGDVINELRGVMNP